MTLTPYDTGERLEPRPWVSKTAGLMDQNRDMFGRVDFDNDESATEFTIYVERKNDQLVINIESHTSSPYVIKNNGEDMQVANEKMSDSDGRIDIHECKRLAAELGSESWFTADFPSGRTRCQWLDPFMGLVQVDTPELRNGFMTVPQLNYMFPDLRCSRPQLTSKS